MKNNSITDRISKARFSSILFVYFTLSAAAIIMLTLFSIYSRLQTRYLNSLQEENQIITEQAARNVESYVQEVMKLSDTVYYDVIKNADPTAKETTEKVTLLYDSQKEMVENIAVFSRNGELLVASPAARIRENLRVVEQSWFSEALKRTDIMSFSSPHVQTIFENSDNSYDWVITFSRSVELLQEDTPSQGVLMIDLSFSGLSGLLNTEGARENGYVYLMSGDGEMICHPKQMLISSGLQEEIILNGAELKDGIHRIKTSGGEPKLVSVKTIGYTGWKTVGIMSVQQSNGSAIKNALFMLFIMAFLVFLLVLINYQISSRLTSPILRLEQSINSVESGNLDTKIYVGGSYEIRHLGMSVAKMTGRIKELMQDIVKEHEAKRRSEFDALQSQINPHFLYNTLDIIVWMIENEQKEEASRVVTALGRFFRISLSRGKNIIRVEDELEHVRNYLLIQQRRFKGKFTFRIEADPSLFDFAALKLMLQPLAENAVYHGMEYMDGDGEILIRAFSDEEKLCFEVSDNGLGMTEEMAMRLLDPLKPVQSSSAHGSGIGVRNVNERIKLYFGEQYGLEILSEPDEGTCVRIHLPAVDYQEMEEKNR